ncbi:hypothetical protein [Terrisporobacter sp.]
MDNGKKYIFIGLILNTMGILVKYLYIFSVILPNFLKGFLEGFFISLGIVILILGLYCESYTIKNLKNSKKKIVSKILRK